ncbi:unnamed protein product [Auanema sp. JU1783]|nr:unnamed protein product [Auanema sp. JU1783]
MGKTIKVTARRDGTVTEKTLRRAFLLEDDVPVALFRDDIALEYYRKDMVVELDEEWSGARFELCWEEERRSRPVTPVEPKGIF